MAHTLNTAHTHRRCGNIKIEYVHWKPITYLMADDDDNNAEIATPSPLLLPPSRFISELPAFSLVRCV